MPAGAVFAGDPDMTVVAVVLPRAEVEEAPSEEPIEVGQVGQVGEETRRRGLSACSPPCAGSDAGPGEGRSGWRIPGWWSAWATPGPAMPATGTTSARWSPPSSRAGRATAFGSDRSRAKVADTRIGTAPGGVPGPRALLAQPITYMNVSGGPVAALLRYHRLGPDRLVVVHDELDLPFATRAAQGRWGRGRAQRAALDQRGDRYQGLPAGAGSASAARPAGRTRPTTCCRTSPRPSARTCRGSSTPRPTRWSCWSRKGLAAAQLRFHSPEA